MQNQDYLVQCPHHLKRASTSAGANAQVLGLAPGYNGKTAKILCAHCLIVHKIQKKKITS